MRMRYKLIHRAEYWKSMSHEDAKINSRKFLSIMIPFIKKIKFKKKNVCRAKKSACFSCRLAFPFN